MSAHHKWRTLSLVCQVWSFSLSSGLLLCKYLYVSMMPWFTNISKNASLCVVPTMISSFSAVMRCIWHPCYTATSRPSHPFLDAMKRCLRHTLFQLLLLLVPHSDDLCKKCHPFTPTSGVLFKIVIYQHDSLLRNKTRRRQDSTSPGSQYCWNRVVRCNVSTFLAAGFSCCK